MFENHTNSFGQNRTTSYYKTIQIHYFGTVQHYILKTIQIHFMEKFEFKKIVKKKICLKPYKSFFSKKSNKNQVCFMRFKIPPTNFLDFLSFLIIFINLLSLMFWKQGKKVEIFFHHLFIKFVRYSMRAKLIKVIK